MPVKSENSLGKRIRNARLARWMSQVDLAAAVGMTQQALSSLEKDRGQPTAVVLVKIADALALPEAEILALSGRLRQNATKYLRKHPKFWTLIHKIAIHNLSDAALDTLTALVPTLLTPSPKDGGEVGDA